MHDKQPEQKNTRGKRILWDEDEALLLADACIKVHNNNANRKEIIATTSIVLRHRAESLGLDITDKFRNENGIAMQMTSLERAMYQDNRTTWHCSKLFHHISKMFQTQPDEFRKKLDIAKKRWFNTSPTSKTSDV